MKLKTILLAMLAAVCLASCSDDDEKVLTPAEKITGEYCGLATVSMPAMPAFNSISNDTVNISAINGKANITLGAIASGRGETLPKFTIENANVTTTDNATYTIDSTAFSTTGLRKDGSEMKIAGYVKGNVVAGKATLTFGITKAGTMPAALMPMMIAFTTNSGE
jgi:hypothetical protein